MTRHILTGLRPQPLAAYLAGLGLIRVLGEQADPDLTAAWEPDGLSIETTVDDLSTWLCERYQPTPVLSPWNEGSGFGVKDKEPKKALDLITAHSSPRLAGFRAALPAATRAAIGQREHGWPKERTVREFRNGCPDEVLPWIDAAVVLVRDDAYFPPLLGTGGNDGRLDFSTNYHQRLLELFDTAPANAKRTAALAHDLLTGRQAEKLVSAAIGQFSPGASGGRNSSPFGAADAVVNPWEFVLLVEGSMFFASATVKRDQHAVGRAAMPFTVFDSAEGSATGAADEKSRGELWAPAWERRFTLAEIRQLFTEARASWHGKPAQRSIEFLGATRTLGVSRGIDSFTRFGLHQRNGLAFTAVPIETITVRNLPKVALAARLADWVTMARRSESHAVTQAARAFDAAQYEFVRDGEALALGRMLAGLTNLELAVGRSGRARENVPPRTPPRASEFLDYLTQDEESPELRLAVGIASCGVRLEGNLVRSMRQILLPIDPGRPRPAWRETALVPGFGLRPVREVLADVLLWRARTVEDEPTDNPVAGVATFRSGMRVPAADTHRLVGDDLNEHQFELWLRAALALNWIGVRHTWSHAEPTTDLTGLLGLLQPLADGIDVGDDERSLALAPDWPARIVAGQLTQVHGEAVRRLARAGRRAIPAQPGYATDAGVRIAAALVPRTTGAIRLLDSHLATRLVTRDEESTEESES